MATSLPSPGGDDPLPEVKVTNGRTKGQGHGHGGREDDLAPLVPEEDNESGDFESAQPLQNGWAGVEGMEPPAFMVRFCKTT